MAKATGLKIFLFVFLQFCALATPITAREPGDFSDLMEGEEEIIGSEKELKYKIRGFPIVEWERWPEASPDHSSFLLLFGLYKSTSYPRFDSLRILPFYYSMRSKVDDRQRSFIFPLFLYQRVDGDDRVTAAPLYYHHRNNVTGDSFRWLALYISDVTRTESDRAILPLVYFGSSQGGAGYVTVFPLFYYGSSPDDSFSLLTPLFYHTRQQGTTFSISPLHYYATDRPSAASVSTAVAGAAADKSAGDKSDLNATFGFPVLPLLFYRSRSGTTVHYNVLTFTDFVFDEKGLHRFWFFPFLSFYGRGRYFYSPLYMTAYEPPSDLASGDWFRHVPALLFFSWGNEKPDQMESTYWQIPFFYRSRDTKETHINILGLLDWNRLRTPDGADPFSHFHVMPLFFYFQDPQADMSTTMVPIVYYRHREGPQSHINVLLGLDLAFDEKGLDRFWLFPLLSFYGRDRYFYSPLFMTAYDTPELASGEAWFRHVPALLFFSWGHERAGKGTTSGVHTSESTYWQFPFFYRSSEPRNYPYGSVVHTNVLGLIDWNSIRREGASSWLSRLLVLPLFYYFSDVWPDIAGQPEIRAYSVTLFPLFRHRWSPVRTSNFSLLHYYSDERPSKAPAEAPDDSVTLGIPLIPFLFYRSREGTKTHYNFLTGIDFATDDKGLDRFWFWPLLSFYGRDRYFYSPFFMTATDTPERASGESWYRHVPMALFFSWGNDPGSGPKAGPAGALGDASESKPESTYWQFPLFYRTATGDETHTNILGLLDWAGNEAGFTRVWTLPLFFYKKDSYLYALPFFFRGVGGDAKIGRSFGPFHYHSWSPEHERLWLLLHYSSCFRRAGAACGDEKSDRVFHIAPLYFSWHDKESTGDIFLPFYLNYEEPNGKEYHVNVSGLSWSKTPGTLQVSVGMETKETGRYWDMDVAWLYNMVSYSSRRRLPDWPWSKTEPPEKKAGAAASGTGDNKTAKDNTAPALARKNRVSREDSEFFQGFQFLYGAVAYEIADTKRHFRLLPLAWFTWDKNSEDRVKVIPPIFLSYSADDLEYFVIAPFYGMQRERQAYIYSVLLIAFIYETDKSKGANFEYSALWPLVNIHKSTEKSGFRVLPLYWQKSTYKTAESPTETFSSWSPLHYYGYSQEGSTESTALWFTLGYYSSDRIGTTGRSSLVTPLFYMSSAGSEGTEEIFHISPLHFYSSQGPAADAGSKSGPGGSGEVSTDSASSALGFPVLPLFFYRSREGAKTHYNFLSFFDFGFDHGKLDRVWIWPLLTFYGKNRYFYSPIYMGSQDKSGGEEEWFGHAPVLLFFSWGSGSGENEESTYWQLPLFYRSSAAKETHTNIAGLIDWSTAASPKKEGAASSSVAHFFALPLFFYFYDQERKESSVTFVPFFHQETSPEATFGFSLLHFYSAEKRLNPTGADEGPGKGGAADSVAIGLPILPFLFYRSREGDSSHYNFLSVLDFGFDGKHLDRVWFFPLLTFYGREEYFYSPVYMTAYDKGEANPEETWFRHVPLLLFFSWGSRVESTYWQVPFYYRSTAKTDAALEAHTNILGLLDWKTTNGELSRFFFLNTYYEYDAAQKERSLHFIPLYFSWSGKAENRLSLWIAGLYLHYSDHYTRANFLYLYDRQVFLRANMSSTRFLFGAVAYESSSSEVEFSVLWRALGGYHGWNNSERYNWNVLWLVQSRNADQFHSSFLPVWWYSSSNTGHRLIIPPLLTYSAADEEGLLQLVGGGLIWYRSYDARERTDSQYALLGAAYRHVEVPSERGFSATGSFWGLLWNYESESENQYYHYSVLKLVYSRSRDPHSGQITTRIMGVRLD